MSFRHPLCVVPHSPNSRAKMLAILQWYRIMSPTLSLKVTEVTYDEEKKSAFLDITQTFHIRYSLLQPAPARYAHVVLYTSMVITRSKPQQAASAPQAPVGHFTCGPLEDHLRHRRARRLLSPGRLRCAPRSASDSPHPLRTALRYVDVCSEHNAVPKARILGSAGRRGRERC